MTVRELIEELQKMPPDFEVVYLDYEYGETDVNEVKLKELTFRKEKQIVVELSD